MLQTICAMFKCLLCVCATNKGFQHNSFMTSIYVMCVKNTIVKSLSKNALICIT